MRVRGELEMHVQGHRNKKTEDFKGGTCVSMQDTDYIILQAYGEYSRQVQ